MENKNKVQGHAGIETMYIYATEEEVLKARNGYVFDISCLSPRLVKLLKTAHKESKNA